MRELSLHVLDIAENSIAANASLINIDVCLDEGKDSLYIFIGDNGKGMTAEQISMVCDPFFTTRTTRKVGLGIPLFKMAAELCNGRFDITSQVGVGTKLTAIFQWSHIDRLPVGDLKATICNLIFLNPNIDFIYAEKVNDDVFTLNTKELRDVLGDTPLNDLEVTEWIKSYIAENSKM